MGQALQAAATCLSILFTCACVACLPQRVQSARIVVSTTGSDDPTCGATIDHPCHSLSYALVHVAHPGDEIELAPGVYRETSNTISFASDGVRDVQVTAKAYATIDRAYNGQLFVFRDGAGNVGFDGVRFINGGWLKANSSSALAGGLMTFTDGAHHVEFVNCTFEHHRIEASGFAARGGVGNILAGSPRFTNCQFIDNWAGIASAFYVTGEAAPVFEDCEFVDSGCYQAGWGGVIVPEGNSSGTWTRCVFRNNSCDYGGVIDDGLTSSSKFVDCTFENNFSSFYGGAYYGYGSTRTVFDGCLFRNNGVAKGADGQDFFLSSTVTTVFRNSRFEAGSLPQGAVGGACGRIQDSSSVIMENCTVSGYVGSFGAFQVDINATGTFESCVFANNSATRGGVIAAFCPVTVRNSQFFNNTASEGGAVYVGGVYVGNTFEIIIDGCEFSGNTGISTGGAVHVTGRAILRTSHSNFSGNLALGLGGGAVFTKTTDSILFSKQDTFVANTAPVGGAIWSAVERGIRDSLEKCCRELRWR
ncbi:TPA: hypothetical protein N0F65_002510 [Lagenidium giganteum]|uniref:Right handed beta helix domain-containing protein n=1 Tax=Lagenidium giganteum TaxID=4803 RepID=A0AAV2YV20_9STRA|nr:TPA: hypothetical protein N0F65_002510 [Lagenidium giganteum]